MAQIFNLFLILCIVAAFQLCLTIKREKREKDKQDSPSNCIVGIFLDRQVRARKEPPEENPNFSIQVKQNVSCGEDQDYDCYDNFVDQIPTTTRTFNVYNWICESISPDGFSGKAWIFVKVCNENWKEMGNICCENKEYAYSRCLLT